MWLNWTQLSTLSTLAAWLLLLPTVLAQSRGQLVFDNCPSQVTTCQEPVSVHWDLYLDGIVQQTTYKLEVTVETSTSYMVYAKLNATRFHTYEISNSRLKLEQGNILWVTLSVEDTDCRIRIIHCSSSTTPSSSTVDSPPPAPPSEPPSPTPSSEPPPPSSESPSPSQVAPVPSTSSNGPLPFLSSDQPTQSSTSSEGSITSLPLSSSTSSESSFPTYNSSDTSTDTTSSPPATNSSPPPVPHRGPNAAMIGGIVGGASGGVLIIVLGILCFRRHSPSRTSKIDLKEHDDMFHADPSSNGRVDPYPMMFPNPSPARGPVAPDAWVQNFKPRPAATESFGYAPGQFTTARLGAFLDDGETKSPSTAGYTLEQAKASQQASQTDSTLKTSTAGDTASTSPNRTTSWAPSTITAATASVAEPPAQPIIHEVDVGPVQPIRLPPMYNEAWSRRNDNG